MRVPCITFQAFSLSLPPAAKAVAFIGAFALYVAKMSLELALCGQRTTMPKVRENLSTLEKIHFNTNMCEGVLAL